MGDNSLKIFRGAASSVSSSIMSKVYAFKEHICKERHVTNGESIAKKDFAA